jgi:hypothetical protein
MLAGVLAGCGGSDSKDDDPQTQTRPSSGAQADFVRRLDSLCQATRPDLAGIQADLIAARDAARSGRVGARETFATFATLLKKAEVETKRFVAQLKSLPVPQAEKAFHERVTKSTEAGVSNLRLQIRAAQAQDAVRLRALSLAGTSIDSERKGLFAGHGGFRYCARG